MNVKGIGYKKKKKFDISLIVKMFIAFISIVIYLICLYAGLTGNIKELQVVVEKSRSRGITGFAWMICGIMASIGLTLIGSILDDLNKCKWRKKHIVITDILEIALPMSIMVLLNMYKADGIIGVLIIVIVFAAMLLLANRKNIICKLKSYMKNEKDVNSK